MSEAVTIPCQADLGGPSVAVRHYGLAIRAVPAVNRLVIARPRVVFSAVRLAARDHYRATTTLVGFPPEALPMLLEVVNADVALSLDWLLAGGLPYPRHHARPG